MKENKPVEARPSTANYTQPRNNLHRHIVDPWERMLQNSIRVRKVKQEGIENFRMFV
mgnify:FL=1